MSVDFGGVAQPGGLVQHEVRRRDAQRVAAGGELERAVAHLDDELLRRRRRHGPFGHVAVQAAHLCHDVVRAASRLVGGCCQRLPNRRLASPAVRSLPGRSTRRRSSCRLLLRAETCDAKSSLPCSSLPFVWRPACGLHEPCREGRGSVAGRRQGAGFLRGRRSRPGKHHRPAAVRRTSLNGMILALLGMPAASLKVVIRTYSLMRNVPSRLRKVGWLRYSGTVRNPGRGLACERTKRGEPSFFTARCWA